MPLELNMLIEGEQRRVWSLTDPSNPATVREHTKKLAIIRRTAPRAPINSKQGHDYKAYLIGQQRLQSMPHSLAKSRTKSRQNQLPFAAPTNLLKPVRHRILGCSSNVTRVPLAKVSVFHSGRDARRGLDLSACHSVAWAEIQLCGQPQVSSPTRP